MDALRSQLVPLRAELDNPAKFKSIYQFAFDFGKESSQKSLPLDVAVPLWQLLLESRFALLSLWCDFVQEYHKKAISRDTWNLLLDFSRNVKGDLSNYDADGMQRALTRGLRRGLALTRGRAPGRVENRLCATAGAWPVLIDDFVAYARDRQKA